MKRIRVKKNPLSAAGVHAFRAEHTRSIEPVRALAASDLVNQAYGLTPAEIELMWKTAAPRMPFAPPGYRIKVGCQSCK